MSDVGQRDELATLKATLQFLGSKKPVIGKFRDGNENNELSGSSGARVEGP
jgi:hypothetical protein